MSQEKAFSDAEEIGRLKGLVEADQVRIDSLDRNERQMLDRIDELARKPLPSPPALPPWVQPVATGAAGLVSALVAVLGFQIVHRLSEHRQRRDEFFKMMQASLALLDEISKDGAKAWRQAGNDDNAQEIAKRLPTQVARLSGQLVSLNKRQPGRSSRFGRGQIPAFDVQQLLIEFRRSATLDIEDTNRQADPARADGLLNLAAELAREIDDAYFNIFG